MELSQGLTLPDDEPKQRGYIMKKQIDAIESELNSNLFNLTLIVCGVLILYCIKFYA